MARADHLARTNAPWGISRIAQVDSLKGQDPNGAFHYEYDPAGGDGVDAYIIGALELYCLLHIFDVCLGKILA